MFFPFLFQVFWELAESSSSLFDKRGFKRKRIRWKIWSLNLIPRDLGIEVQRKQKFEHQIVHLGSKNNAIEGSWDQMKKSWQFCLFWIKFFERLMHHFEWYLTFWRRMYLVNLSFQIVVIGCGLLYSLPKIPLFPGYSHSVFPIILPFLLPVVQVNKMK